MNKTVFSKDWFFRWAINLIDVFLLASAVNFLFRWLAGGNSFDMAGFFLSLVVGIFVYFVSISLKSKLTLSKKLGVSVVTLVLWAILIPVVLQTFGYNG